MAEDLEPLRTSVQHLQTLSQVDVALERDLATARERRIWTRDWILRRPEQNFLYQEIEAEDENKFKQAFRMTPDVFKKLLELIEDDIRKKDTTMRQSISPATRLQVIK